jgi:hypothetical protein
MFGFKKKHCALVDGWLDRLSIALAAILAILLCSGLARAQSGSFVIPGIRAGGGSDFAYWDLFAAPPGGGANFNYNNPPALLDGNGYDDDGNPTTAFTARTNLRQTGTGTCFVTSSGALYSFAAPTAFEVPYTPPVSTTGEVTNVIFQTQTGGTRMNLDGVRLSYVQALSGGGSQTVLVAPLFRALDDPQTGSFTERLVSGFQWNLTGQGVRDFKIVFSAPGSSMPMWQAQLDAVVGAPFVQELGYLLFTQSRPLTRFGRPGAVDKNLAPGVDGRYFVAGQNLNLLGLPEADWEHVGFLYNNVVYAGASLPLVFPAADATVTAIFAPLTYGAWREAMFLHYNALTGTPADNTDNAVSAPMVDHDLDGLVNVAEYAFGCDPYVRDAERATSTPIPVTISSQTYPAVRFRTNSAPDGFADVSVVVQTSTDLVNWKDNDTEPQPVTEIVSSELQADGSSIVTARAMQPLGSGALFFRLSVR